MDLRALQQALGTIGDLRMGRRNPYGFAVFG